MPSQTGMCEPEWKAAKLNFEKKTDAKKPSKKFLGVRLGSGVDAALKKMDEVYTKAVKEPDAAKRLKVLDDYEKKLGIFVAERKSYKSVLEKAAASEESSDELIAHITVLIKQLSATEAGAKDNLNTQRLSALKTIEKANSGGEEIHNDKEAKDAENAKGQIKKMIPSLKSAVKAGALFVAKVKAEPTAATFNDGIQSAARKITQNLAWVEKIDKALGTTMGVDLDETKRILTVMDPWSSGKRKVPVDSDKAMVLRELGAYAQMLAAGNKLLKEMEAAV